MRRTKHEANPWSDSQVNRTNDRNRHRVAGFKMKGNMRETLRAGLACCVMSAERILKLVAIPPRLGSRIRCTSKAAMNRRTPERTPPFGVRRFIAALRRLRACRSCFGNPRQCGSPTGWPRTSRARFAPARNLLCLGVPGLVATVITFMLALPAAAADRASSPLPIPAAIAAASRPVPEAEMQRVYEEVKTPYKYGIVIQPDEDEMVDCPSVFRHDGKWFMVYVAIRGKTGYETHLAESDDLLSWRPLGRILPFSGAGWDRWQADGGAVLIDHSWGGSGEIQAYDGRYWMTYIGGAKQGYEPDPLAIGVAWTRTPGRATPWTRLEENPVLAPDDPDARPFERATLYKSQVIWDRDESLGFPFVMFYNAKQVGPGTERIGMAVSRDMRSWVRFGPGPVIDHGRGIAGDPQIVRLGDLWVMFYFGHRWKPKAFDTFACSYDLVHWTTWDGPLLIEPSEPWDETFAHKPWVLKHDGIVYHFYCAVGDRGRAIALATSKPLGGPAAGASPRKPARSPATSPNAAADAPRCMQSVTMWSGGAADSASAGRRVVVNAMQGRVICRAPRAVKDGRARPCPETRTGRARRPRSSRSWCGLIARRRNLPGRRERASPLGRSSHGAESFLLSNHAIQWIDARFSLRR